VLGWRRPLARSRDVAYWHKADIRGIATFCPLLDKSGQWSAPVLNGLVANDPTATLAVHCGNGFDAGFSPYQSTLLSR
jgi:hypothetical protein